MPEEGNYRHLFQIDTIAEAAQGFDILAITAGLGNGWTFSPDVLQKSLPLWDQVECFIDHSQSLGRSIRDLAGLCLTPSWDNLSNGIRLNLQPFGPAGDLLTEIGRAVLSSNTPPKIGFSADIAFVCEPGTKKVKEITKIFSLDLVYNPARGGAFVRVLNQMEDEPMPEPNTPEQEKLILAQCRYTLSAALAASGLPEAVQTVLRDQFSAKVFDPDDLDAAIKSQQKIIAALTAPASVSGLKKPSITGGEDSRMQLQAAVDDLFNAPRDEDAKSLQVHKLSGIRELYLMLTGDTDMHGGYHPERAQLATTADFTGLVKNALNKVIADRWTELGRAGYSWWEKIVTVEHFNTLNSITGVLTGTVGSLPTVAEGAEYTELQVGDSPETASFTKYGGYIPLTLELIDRDDTRKLASYPRELAAAGLRKLSSLIAAIFTDNTGTGPTLADGGALFNSTAVTTAGGHANLLTAALAADKWDLVCAAVYNQPMLIKNATGLYGTGSKMAVNPRYLLVPRALQLTAMKIMYPSLENAANIYSENQQRGQPGDVITVPEWTSTTNFAAVVDPRIVPGIFVGERFGIMPEVFIAGSEQSPAVFANDEHRLKVRMFAAVWVNDFRPLHKTNV